MKLCKLSVLLCTILFIGCETNVIESPRIVLTTGWNFSKYSENGFPITPEAYNGKYTSIGLVTVTVFP